MVDDVAIGIGVWALGLGVLLARLLPDDRMRGVIGCAVAAFGIGLIMVLSQAPQ